MDVVVAETAEICDGCTNNQGMDLGRTSLYKGAKRHPTLAIDVVVRAAGHSMRMPDRTATNNDEVKLRHRPPNVLGAFMRCG